MSNTPPTPPDALPDSVVDTLLDCSPAVLRQITEYTEALAAYRQQEERLDEDGVDEERPDDRPDDVPAKATTTIKEINDNRYYYWQ